MEDIVQIEITENAAIAKIMLGSITMYHIPDIESSLISLVDSKCKKIIIDLEKVSYLDSAALGAIFRIKKSIEEKDGCLILTGINDTIKMVFSITRFDNYIKVTSSVEEALQAGDNGD